LQFIKNISQGEKAKSLDNNKVRGLILTHKDGEEYFQDKDDNLFAYNPLQNLLSQGNEHGQGLCINLTDGNINSILVSSSQILKEQGEQAVQDFVKPDVVVRSSNFMDDSETRQNCVLRFLSNIWNCFVGAMKALGNFICCKNATEIAIDQIVEDDEALTKAEISYRANNVADSEFHEENGIVTAVRMLAGQRLKEAELNELEEVPQLVLQK
jgi:hypothetical protein